MEHKSTAKDFRSEREGTISDANGRPFQRPPSWRDRWKRLSRSMKAMIISIFVATALFASFLNNMEKVIRFFKPAAREKSSLQISNSPIPSRSVRAPEQPLSSPSSTISRSNKMSTYDVVISFAGEDRSIAEAIASGLVTKGINVFYDEYEQPNLWGKDLYSHLTNIYRDQSKYCLMIISKSYAKKQWTNHERKAAQARAFRENSEYILPLRLDDAPVEGLLDTVGYIDYRTTPTEKVVELIVEKVYQYNKEHGIKYEIVKAEEVFARQKVTLPGGRAIRDSDMITKCPTCKAEQALSEATLSLDEDNTIYTRKNGCQPVAVISRPGIVAWPGRGYRIGEFVIRNAEDIRIKTEDMVATLLIPASKAALMKKKPDG